MGPKNRVRQEHHIVAAQKDIGLLARNQKEVLIAKAAASFEIDLLFLEAQWARIVRMRVGVEVSQDDNVHAQGPEDLEPLRTIVERALVGEHFTQMHVKVTDQHFVPRHRFINVVMRVSQNGLLGGPAAARTQIKIDGHALPGSWRCIVQGVVVCLRPRFRDTLVPNFVRDAVGVVTLSVVWLSHSYGKRVLAVLAIVHVAQIHFIFAGKKELVRRWEKAQRSPSGLHNAQTVARAEPYWISNSKRCRSHIPATLVLRRTKRRECLSRSGSPLTRPGTCTPLKVAPSWQSLPAGADSSPGKQ